MNEERNIYIGYTKDLKKRLIYHNSGKSRYTKGHKWELIYYEAFRAKQDAMRREKSLKKGQSRRWLIERIKHSLHS